MKLQHKKIVLNQIFSYNFGGVCRIMFINETEDCIGDITNVLLLLSFTNSEKPGTQGIPLLHVPNESTGSTLHCKARQFKAGSLRRTQAIKVYLHLMYKIKYTLRA